MPELQRTKVIEKDRALLSGRTDQQQAMAHARVGRSCTLACLCGLGCARVTQALEGCQCVFQVLLLCALGTAKYYRTILDEELVLLEVVSLSFKPAPSSV